MSLRKSCPACRTSFEVQDEDLAFYRKISPSFCSKQYDIPAPTHCPDCRLQRRLAYRNEFTYYARSCSLCGKSIVATHSSDAAYPVYCYKCWWSDNWDGIALGQAYNPRRSFIEQFTELRNRVPQLAMMNDNGVVSENSEYCQDISNCKNCYLLTAAWFAQDTYYSTQCNHVKDMLDSLMVSVESELVYHCTFSQHLYNCSFLTRCFQCSECHFGMDLRGCSNCCGCVGLRRKNYCFFNEQLSAKQYQAQVNALRLDSATGQAAARRRFHQFRLSFPHRAVSQTNCENCRGDALFNCKNFTGFGMCNAQDCRFVWTGDGALNSYDVNVTGAPQWCYEGATPDNSYMTHFSAWCWKNKFLLYCDNCHSSDSLLGCAGLKRQEHCILNQRYSKDDYEALAARIIEDMQSRGEWGEFFPMDLSPFAYNESRAFDLFPLTQEQVLEQGLRWREDDRRNYRPASAAAPEAIGEVPDSLTKEVLACEQCRRNYRIQSGELALYRRMSLPLPRACPECRRRTRFSEFPSSGKLYPRACDQCRSAIDTVFPPGSAERVLCEACYLKVTYE